MARIPSANPYNIRPGEASPYVDLSGQSQHIDNRYRGPTTWIPRLATMGVTAGLGAAAAPFLLGAGGAGVGAAGSAVAPTASAAGSGGYSSPGVFSGLFGGGGGAAGAAGSSASAIAPVAASAARFRLGDLFKLAEFGVPAVTQLIGMRSQNRAMDRQAAMEQRTLAEQMAFAREQEAFRRAEADRVAREDQRRWEIEQQNRGRELAAAEEERAFNRRLIEEREARRNQARLRLADFLRMGR